METGFELYSQRAREAIFVARYLAGITGSSTLDVDYLLAALIYEDQGEVWKALGDTPELQHVPWRATRRTHQAFFSPELAAELLRKIEQSLPRSAPIPSSQGIPMSTQLKELLSSAYGLMEKLHHAQIQPLHLLAACVAGSTSRGAELMRQASVTESKVIEALSSARPGSD